MLVLFNFVYASVSTPAGILSDKLGRRRVILLGWLIYALVYLGFGLASASWQLWLLFALYGLYYGLAEGVARAFVADLVPVEKRGTAYGLFHGIVRNYPTPGKRHRWLAMASGQSSGPISIRRRTGFPGYDRAAANQRITLRSHLSLRAEGVAITVKLS